MTANLVVLRGARWSKCGPVALALVGILAWSTSTAHAQVGRRAGEHAAAGGGAAVGNASGQIISDTIVGVTLAPLLLVGQVAEVFNQIFESLLHLPEAEFKRLQGVTAEMAAKIDAVKTLPAKERRAKMLAMIPELETEYIARIEKELDAEQRAQFRQILIQLRGPMALLQSDVATSLQLSEEQRTKLAATATDSNQRIKDSVSNGEELGAFRIAEVLGLRKRRDQKLLAVLTSDQLEQWNKLKGEQKIDVEALLAKIVKAHLLPKSKGETEAKQSGTPEAPPPPAPPPPSSSPPANGKN